MFPTGGSGSGGSGSGGSSGGSSGGGGGIPFDPRGYSSSGGSTGLPDWAVPYLQGWVSNMNATTPFAQYQAAVNAMSNSGPLNQMYNNYTNALSNLNRGGEFIEKQRNLMNQQYASDIQQPIRQAMGNAMGNMVGRGTLGSSMSNDWMRQFSNQVNQAGAAQQNASNQWAANQNMGLLGQQVAANQQGFGTALGWQGQKLGAPQSYAAMLMDLLGLSRTSRQSSSAVGDLPGDLQTYNP